MSDTPETIYLIPGEYEEGLDWCNDPAPSPGMDPAEAVEYVRADVYHALIAERDGWVESARHFANGQEFYQGIVRQIGRLFGEVACTSDDGSVQGDVLALKVPELVEALAAHVERLRYALTEIASLTPVVEDTLAQRQSWNKVRDIFTETPETSLAKLKAQWQAEALVAKEPGQ